MLFLTETISYFYMCWRLTRGKDKAVLESKISRMLCRKALAYAGMPSFYGFAYEKFYGLTKLLRTGKRAKCVGFSVRRTPVGLSPDKDNKPKRAAFGRLSGVLSLPRVSQA